MAHVRCVFVLSTEDVIETLKPDKPGQFQALSLQFRKQFAIVFLYVFYFRQHVAIGRAVVLFDFLQRWQRRVLLILFVVLPDPLLSLVEILLEHRFRKTSRRGTEEFIERVPTPGGLDQQDRLVEMVSHGRSKLQFHPGTARRPIANRERAFAIQELDEHIITNDPLVVLTQMGEEVFGLRVGRLVVEQGVTSLAFHVRLTCENKHLHALVGGMHRHDRESEYDEADQRSHHFKFSSCGSRCNPLTRS